MVWKGAGGWWHDWWLELLNDDFDDLIGAANSGFYEKSGFHDNGIDWIQSVYLGMDWRFELQD